MAINGYLPELHSDGTLLSESENVAVFQCSCGNIHLQVGAVSLTMQPEELLEIADVIGRGLAHLEKSANAPARAPN